MYQNGTLAVVVLTLLFAFQNCGSSDGELKSGTPQELQYSQKLDDLSQLIQSDLSCSSDSDCEVVEIGEQACGGAAGVAVVSKLNPQRIAIDQLLLEIVQLSRERNRQGQVSICMLLLMPTPKCEQSQCVAR